MRITKPRRPGDAIVVDLLKPSSLSPDGWLKPVEFEISEPPTIYVRVPHGNFAVRIMTSSDAEVLVSVDGAEALKTTVTKGIHILDRDSQGRAFKFSPEAAGEPQGESPKQATLFAADEVQESKSSHGLVCVQVRFCDVQNGSAIPDVTPDFPYPLFFQMNPPGAHEETFAGLLSKLKTPEKLTDAEDIFEEHKHKGKLPQRHCVNCGHDH